MKQSFRIHINYIEDVLLKQRCKFHKPTKIFNSKKTKSRKREKDELREELKREGYLR